MLARAVVDALDRIAPLCYADRSWDNVGLILEGSKDVVTKLMVCNDMTESVLHEASQKAVDFIIAYHPPWFRAEKRMTMEESCAVKMVCKASVLGMSIYSPHTALDAIQGGINDWLCGIFKCSRIAPIMPCSESIDGMDPIAGYGRTAILSEPITLAGACKAIMRHLSLDSIRLARSSTKHIHSVAVCAGSGGSILTPKCKVDLVITGELSHHQILALIAVGTNVVLTEHSNSERLYLRSIYCEKIKQALGHQVEVVFSESDKEPIEIVSNMCE